MNRFFLLLLPVILLTYFRFAQASVDLSILTSPVIVEDTLVIQGPIDSHIYDFISRERQAIQATVRWVSLNSYGGNHNWALEIARQIRELGLSTRLEESHFCASACVYLFGAGRDRLMSSSTWIGVHGARLSGHYFSTFRGLCFISLGGESVFEPRLDGCQAAIDSWFEVALLATQAGFASMEMNGVSLSLREDYFNFPDDEAWYNAGNVLRKPDWVLGPELALTYNLATDLLD